MRTARKLFLLAITAIAALAFAASAANAVEVSAEGGAHCPEVDADNAHNVTGGCLVEASTTEGNPLGFQNHVHATGEQVFSICENTFNARLHESGDGWLFNQHLEGANCGIVPCDEPTAAGGAQYEWPATLMEFGPIEALQFTFCLRGATTEPGSSFASCTIFVPFAEVPPGHTYVFGTLAPGPHEGSETTALQSRCSQNAATSIFGQWQIHGTPIEITH